MSSFCLIPFGLRIPLLGFTVRSAVPFILKRDPSVWAVVRPLSSRGRLDPFQAGAVIKKCFYDGHLGTRLCVDLGVYLSCVHTEKRDWVIHAEEGVHTDKTYQTPFCWAVHSSPTAGQEHLLSHTLSAPDFQSV